VLSHLLAGRSDSWRIPAFIMALVGVLACGCATNPTRTQHDTARGQTATRSSTTTSVRTTTSSSTAATVCQGVAGPGANPVQGSSAMESLLLTTADVPAGYVTTGPQLSAPSGHLNSLTLYRLMFRWPM
jgi:hypothetical protein